ncbi:MAG: tetratricopeptide repeat protein [Candidatus Omnitrophica bacterium]|nr:tetratricopeptide repeat protein [Candidatus Omnitrophota bacterium]
MKTLYHKIFPPQLNVPFPFNKIFLPEDLKHANVTFMLKFNFWIKLAIFFGLGFLLYANTLHSEYHLDDIPFIVKNPTIRDINDLALIGKSILGTHARHVVFYSLALNYHLHKLDVFGYHVFNTLIHILTTIGIWQFTRLLLSTNKFTAEVTTDNREKIAFCAALLFLCHPANTQAITYITQRFASMATMFYIATLAFYVKARLTTRLAHSLPFYFLAGTSAIMGMLSKEITITMPAIIFIIDRLCIAYQPPIIKKKKVLVVKKSRTPFILIAALAGLSLIVPFLFHFDIASIFSSQMPSSSHEGDMLTFYTFALSQLRVMALLLRLCVLPIDQNLDYDFPMSTGFLTPPTTLISLIFLAGLAFLGWKMLKKRIIVFLGIAWFFITFAPEFYPRVHVVFEHKFYLVTIGLFIAASYLIWELPALKKFAFWIMIVLTLILGIATVKRNAVWQTEQTLWEDVVKKSPNKYRANLNLGNVYQLQGKYDQSLPYYDKAISVMPYGYKALNSRAVIYYMKGNLEAAMNDFNRSIAANPQYDDPYNNRGNLFRQRGEFTKAIEDYNMAIKVSQFAPMAYKNRADVFARLNEVEKSLADYKAALNLDPKLRDAYNNMGNLLNEKGRYSEALALFNAAIQNDPGNSPEYLLGRGNTYSNMQDHKKALAEFLAALKIRPAMPEALFNAGVAFAAMNDMVQADKFYTLTIQANPGLAVAYNNRGNTRRRLGRREEALADFLAADKLSPRVEIIRRNIVISYFEMGQIDKAMNAYNETTAMGVALNEEFAKEFLQKTKPLISSQSTVITQ